MKTLFILIFSLSSLSLSSPLPTECVCILLCFRFGDKLRTINNISSILFCIKSKNVVKEKKFVNKRNKN